MIYKQSAIKMLDAYLDKCKGVMAATVAECIRIILEIPDEDGWISVKDKLPDEFISVLVHIPGESPLPTVKEAYVFDGKWYASHDIYSTGEVTHWKPMPEPPNEG